MIKKNYSCRICGKKKYSKIINLGNQPLSGVFPKIKSNKKVKQSPLNLIRCESCDLIQLYDTANVGDMYGTSYGYNSGLSKLMIDHLKDGFLKLTKYKKLAKRCNSQGIGPYTID